MTMAAVPGSMLNTLCDVLSATVIMGCLVEKLPQILQVFKQKSSQGLSLQSVLLELSA